MACYYFAVVHITSSLGNWYRPIRSLVKTLSMLESVNFKLLLTVWVGKAAKARNKHYLSWLLRRRQMSFIPVIAAKATGWWNVVTPATKNRIGVEEQDVETPRTVRTAMRSPARVERRRRNV